MFVFSHGLLVLKRSDLDVYSSQLASALHDQLVFQVRRPIVRSFYEFPNTNANLIPICNTKSQLKKGITFKFLRLQILLIFADTLTYLYPALKGNRSKKLCLTFIKFAMFFLKAKHGFILTNIYISSLLID